MASVIAGVVPVVGQGLGLRDVPSGQLEVRCAAPRRCVAHRAQHLGFQTPGAAGPRAAQGLTKEAIGVGRVAGVEVRRAEGTLELFG